MTEDQIQIQFFQWLELNYPDEVRFVFHITNGGYRNKAEAMKLKRMGVRPGVADIYCMHLHLFIELKTTEGRVSKSQYDFKLECDKTGHSWEVVHGLIELIKIFKKYRNKRYKHYYDIIS